MTINAYTLNAGKCVSIECRYPPPMSPERERSDRLEVR